VTGFYERHVVPPLVHAVCSLPPIAAQRGRVVPQARGLVLEIGIGSGLNLSHYDARRVTRVIGVDPNPALLEHAGARAEGLVFGVDLVEGAAEALPLEAANIDTALVTYTLCSVGDPMAALAELRRVLKPGGSVLFCEHGRSPNPATARWQDRLTPAWRRLSGGCHLNRDVERELVQSGFAIAALETFKLPWTPGLIGFHYLGSARPR